MKVDDRHALSGQRIVILARALCVTLLLTAHSVSAQDETGDAANVNESASTRVEPRQIFAQAGDTLQSISKREYATIGLWRHIAEYNRLDIAKPLFVGQVILLPELRKGMREFAEIIYTKGTNSLTPASTATSRELQRSDRIFLRDIIETSANGFVSIAFRSGTVANIQPGSRVQLIGLNCLETVETCFIELSAEQGSIQTDVDNESDQSNNFRITTPHASAAVRGTVFDFSANESQMLIGVIDGTVEVSAENQTVSLPAGFGVLTTPGQPPGDLIALLPPPSFTGISPRLAVTDGVSIWPVPDAQSYRWVLANDAAVNEIVREASTDAPFLTIDDVAPGDYYLSVRAIDSLGLKGFAAVEKVAIAELDPADVTIELSITREDRDLIVAVVEPDDAIPGYEIQLADSADFNTIVSIDAGTSGQVIFSAVQDAVFLRARALYDPRRVSRFGPVLEVN